MTLRNEGIDRIAVEQRVARVCAVVDLLALVRDPVTHQQLGSLIHGVRTAGPRPDLGSEAVAVFDSMPMYFSLRDGWSSKELSAAVTDGVALGALDVHAGGVVALGDRWHEYARGTSRRPHRVRAVQPIE